ncbi:SNF2 family DNA or RNA helicase [Roseimicrobium gellanilyticum]|uniref:SNF2 family DNA or RNA helicase n=1 Tax=Roseimicrobium gellanilyticum TaxID=748857 RepID=A0A366HX83_9BACT|nr:DEAD/DEAH box helicase [Roseimicrobium gellanilyticum]RBP48095.1 SNF2 family DNA or RNA helicase [Roseimicrobium gellanilyticum]
MPSASEVEAFISAFDEATVTAARSLVEEGKVRMLQFSEETVEAEVALEEEIVRVFLAKTARGWKGRTNAPTVEPEGAGIAQCAAMLETEAKEEATPTQVQRSLQDVIEERLARQLTASEEQYVAKVEKRYERYRALGEIYDHDLVRLNSRWPVQSYDPLRLWPEPPREVVDFWNYLAAALIERKLTYPSFLDSITDLPGVQAKLASWHQQEDLPRWASIIREFGQREIPGALDVQLRLLVTPNEARFQVRNDSASPWRNLADPELDQLLMLEQQNALRLPLPSRLMLESASRALRDQIRPIVRLDDVAAARWLASLFNQNELSDALITLDETPFARAEDPLRWSAREILRSDGNLHAVLLVLTDASGHEPPKPLRSLPAAEPLYLSSDTVFRGPASFEEGTSAHTSIEIPVAALATEDGVRFLKRLGVELPPSLAKKVRHETFQVHLKAHCLPKVDQGGTEHIAVSASAISSNGLLEQTLRGRRWEVAELQRDEEGCIPCYDRTALEAVPPMLDQLKATYDPELDAFRVRITKTFPEQFHAWAAGLPNGMTLETDTKLETILADPLKATVRLEVNEAGIDWFDLRLVFDIEGLELKPAEIRKLIAARGGFVRLADGTWRSVKLELTEEQQNTIAALGLDINELSDEAHPIHARQLAAQQKKDFLPPELWERIRDRLARLDLETKAPVPDALTITLRPYQVDGFHFLSYLTINRFGGVLADDMGLGKTVQSIAWVLWLRQRAAENNGDKLAPCLVVCPKSVLDVWAIEFGKAAPALRVEVLREKDTLDLRRLQQEADVLVLNYAQLRACIEELQKVNWLAAILDEGQQIKNPDSKVAQAARQLHAQNRLVLTGTPLENRLLDLWSLMTFATPGALGDRAYFQRHFDRRKDDRAAERLSARLRPFILRRTKGQVARELPPRTEENMFCELSGLQEKLYRDQLAQAQHMILTATGADLLNKRRFAILQAITRLRQICCHPALVQPGAENEESAKLNALLELLDQLHDEGHKVLVFSQFVSMLKIIRDKLIALGRPYHWLTGATQNRAEIVQAFQTDPQPSVFLLSLKAGGSGLNLTAASYVILYDPWWNPAVENQAIDRAHRIGQTQPVMAYRLLAKDTIEQKIRLLQQQKQLMSNDVLGEESFARNLGREDLEYLFGLADPVEVEED